VLKLGSCSTYAKISVKTTHAFASWCFIFLGGGIFELQGWTLHREVSRERTTTIMAFFILKLIASFVCLTPNLTAIISLPGILHLLFIAESKFVELTLENNEVNKSRDRSRRVRLRVQASKNRCKKSCSQSWLMIPELSVRSWKILTLTGNLLEQYRSVCWLINSANEVLVSF
jgi:hypothetical protein